LLPAAQKLAQPLRSKPVPTPKRASIVYAYFVSIPKEKRQEAGFAAHSARAPLPKLKCFQADQPYATPVRLVNHGP
jgi:hypothetical protein